MYDYHVIPIDDVTIGIGVADLEEGEDRVLTRYRFKNPLDSPELFSTLTDVDSYSFPKRLWNKRSYVFADVTCSYICSSRRQEVRFRKAFNYYDHWQYNLPIEYCSDEESSDEEEEFLIEANRRERCVLCLKSKPNILYLDCAHIAVCDSCVDRCNYCDLCGAEISKRIKI